MGKVLLRYELNPQEVRAQSFRIGRAKSYVNIKQLWAATYRRGNVLCESVSWVSL
jgi:hypothetical protein